MMASRGRLTLLADVRKLEDMAEAGKAEPLGTWCRGAPRPDVENRPGLGVPERRPSLTDEEGNGQAAEVSSRHMTIYSMTALYTSEFIRLRALGHGQKE